jgi:hypothetical protein
MKCKIQLIENGEITIERKKVLAYMQKGMGEYVFFI